MVLSDQFTGNTQKEKQTSNLTYLKPIIISTYELDDVFDSPQSSSKHTNRVSPQPSLSPLSTQEHNYQNILDLMSAFLLSRCALQLDRNMQIVSLSNYFLSFLTLWSIWHDLFSVNANFEKFPLFKTFYSILIVLIYFGLSQTITALFYSVGSTIIPFFSLVLFSKVINVAIFIHKTLKRKYKRKDVIVGCLLIIKTALYVPLLFLPLNMTRYYWILPLVVDYSTGFITPNLHTQNTHTKQIAYMLVFSLLSIVAQFTLLTFITGILSITVIFQLTLSQSQFNYTQPTKPHKSHSIVLLNMIQSSCGLLFGTSLNFVVQQVNDYYAAYSVYNVIVPNAYQPSVYITMNTVSSMVDGYGGEISSVQYPQALQGKTVVSGGSSYLITWDPNLNLRVTVASFCGFMICSICVLFIGRSDRLWMKSGVLRSVLMIIVVGIGSMNGQIGITMFIECGVVILGLLIEHLFVLRKRWPVLDRIFGRTLDSE